MIQYDEYIIIVGEIYKSGGMDVTSISVRLCIPSTSCLLGRGRTLVPCV